MKDDMNPEPISEAELAKARKDWGDALLKISKAFDEDGIESARLVAKGVLDTLYGYGLGSVLFKPTLASGEKTFRTTHKGALSYFVGHDPEYPLDGGFGIKGWVSMTSKTAASFVEGNVGMWMGWISLTDKNGDVTTVDKSFGYKRDDEGNLRIVHHHSSLPYQP